ncbi:MAG: signal recognition particle-docking protein FtsY [Gammaproteobacteria bacterium]
MSRFKRKKATPQATQQDKVGDSPTKSRGLFGRIKQGLTKTRANLGEGMANLVLGKKTVDADLLEAIETQLILADVGVATSDKIIQNMTLMLQRKELDDGEKLLAAVKAQMLAMLQVCEAPLTITAFKKPYVILVMGVNGAGKTTTIGKMARRFQSEGKKVMLAAGDTFRAAAIEQLQAWGDRNKISVIAQHDGADCAAVIFDGLQAARARNIDVLIADTAGRLHTHQHLMDELRKVKRVIKKFDDEAPHEVMLVLDATIGQNALKQAQAFDQAIPVSGLTMTKLDGTAKGGIIFAIADQLKFPIRFIGVGEKIDDLQVFNAQNFISALFNEES